MRLTGGHKSACPTCRAAIPEKVASNPRINYALTMAIRFARGSGGAAGGPAGPAGAQRRLEIDNAARPDAAFVSDRAQRAGKANACSGRIMVTLSSIEARLYASLDSFIEARF